MIIEGIFLAIAIQMNQILTKQIKPTVIIPNISKPNLKYYHYCNVNHTEPSKPTLLWCKNNFDVINQVHHGMKQT